ncbi:hypothetical protein [Nocardia sp. NPDC049526]|uniref:Rv1733c family protein n=1 Tax=Nocardia sp. NPDC049526 TaxID=3364316 RepID=UPI0037AC97A5
MSQDSAFSVRGARSPLPRCGLLRIWSPNPLLRPSDRLEAVLRLMVAFAVLVAIPVAAALGTDAYADARTRTEDTAKSVVSAVITAEPERTPSHLLEAPVQWIQNGRPGTATVRVSRDAGAGDRVTVWLGATGAPTAVPRRPGTAAMTGIGVGVVVLNGTWVVAWLLLQGSTRVLARHHRAQWDRHWQKLDHPITDDRR